MMAKKESLKKRLQHLVSELTTERSSFLSHWKELGEHILPRRPKMSIDDVNKGDRRNTKIIDMTATLAARNLRAGMMSGMTSPARPWFRVMTPYSGMNEDEEVKFWLHQVSDEMSTIFLKSNLYNVLPIIYGDLGVFGTSAMLVEEDLESVVRFYPIPIGSYYLANDSKNRTSIFVRDFKMTVRQIVEKFAERDDEGNYDWANISQKVKDQFENNKGGEWHTIRHYIFKNDEHKPKKLEAKFKKYRSIYLEASAPDEKEEKFLRDSGYDYFPVLCPRWETNAEDVYGTDCPGMLALGDIKQLQLGEKRILEAIDKIVRPPLKGPTSLMDTTVNNLPGQVTHVNEFEGQGGLRPIYEVNPRILEIENKQQQTRTRISKAFYEDLFLMLANDNRSGITAREIQERHEEKLLALGPVLEQLNQDLLDPLIEITFNFMASQGRLPEAPEALQGMDLKVEYISVMAQAQKMVGIQSVDRFVSFIGQAAQFSPSVLDKIDLDQAADVYGDILGVNPSIIRSDRQVEEIRNRQAQAQAQAQQAQQAAAMVQGAKALSETDMSGDSALNRLMGEGPE